MKFKVGDAIWYRRGYSEFRVGIINNITEGYQLWCNFKSYPCLPKSNEVTRFGDDRNLTWVDKDDVNLFIININRRAS